jgi:tetratricopeptide (TPR) repeat protein
MQGHHRDAINWCNRTIVEATAAGDRKALAYAHQVLDWALDSVGEAGDRIHLQIALEMYEDLGDTKGQAVVLNNLGAAAYFEGRWDDAVEFYERGRLAHERIGDPVGAAIGIFNIGEILSDQGRLDEAEPLLRRTLRTVRAAGERDTIGYALSQLGRVAARRGLYDGALATYDQAKAVFAEIGDSPALIETGARIAECLVLKGDASGALDLVEDLIARDRTLAAVSPLTPFVLRTRGQALLQLGDLDAARTSLEGSLDAALTRRADYEIGLTLRAMTILSEREGRPDPEMAKRCAEILSRLGVIETADPPQAAFGGGSALAP